MVFKEMNNFDKLLHFGVGFLISFFTMVFFQKPIISYFIVIPVAFLKEIYDLRTPGHTADIMDAIITIVGGILAVTLFRW